MNQILNELKIKIKICESSLASSGLFDSDNIDFCLKKLFKYYLTLLKMNQTQEVEDLKTLITKVADKHSFDF